MYNLHGSLQVYIYIYITVSCKQLLHDYHNNHERVLLHTCIRFCLISSYIYLLVNCKSCKQAKKVIKNTNSATNWITYKVIILPVQN